MALNGWNEGAKLPFCHYSLASMIISIRRISFRFKGSDPNAGLAS